LREVRATVPVDEDKEERILDAMDVAWAGMNDWDRKMINRQYEQRGQNPQRSLDPTDNDK
jgi:hypothetical protein